MDKKDFFGKSDPYFKVFRTRETQDAPLVFESEIVMNTLNPQWKEACEPLQKICNSDLNRPLKFEVWDWDKFSSHDLMFLIFMYFVSLFFQVENLLLR